LVWTSEQFGQGRFMSILSPHSADCFTLFKRSLIQSDDLPLADVLSDQLVKDVFEEERVEFGLADEDVFTPAITLWAMVSQFLFGGRGRSVKAAAGRIVSLYAQVAGRVVAQNAGNYCRAKAKIPVSALKKLTRSLASRAEYKALEFDDLRYPIEEDQAEQRLSPKVIASIRSRVISGRLINVDGFTIDALDTPENQQVYPQNPVQAEGLGFPILRCVSLISMVTGMLIDLATAAYSGKGSGETTLLRKLKGSLRPGDILVADSYYCTYWLVSMCQQLGVEVVMKSQSPEAIERELWTGLLTYNFVRSKMLQAAYSFDREVRSLSFTETYQVLSTNWLLCACVGVSKPMASASLGQSVCAVVGNRPGRVEPRENKRRPKILKLMTVARRVFHAALAALTKTP
jgi:hypothetical protein